MGNKHIFACILSFIAGTGFCAFLQAKTPQAPSAQQVAIIERNKIYLIERGAEDDAADLALSEHQEVNYVRCYLRSAGFVTCQVHTPPVDVEATCRARQDNELLVDGTRCRWNNPESMAHP